MNVVLSAGGALCASAKSRKVWLCPMNVAVEVAVDAARLIAVSLCTLDKIQHVACRVNGERMPCGSFLRNDGSSNVASSCSPIRRCICKQSDDEVFLGE